MAKSYIHEIPEGYEARIEGNKVIIELRESDDERIRKEIIEFVDTTTLSTDERHHRWIAYLEKQKEPHYTKRNALFDKCVAECDPEIMQRVSDEIDETLEKEQKPVEWSRQSIIDALTKWLTEKIAPLHKKSLDGTITEREEMFMAALLEIRSLVNSPDFQIGKDTSGTMETELEDFNMDLKTYPYTKEYTLEEIEKEAEKVFGKEESPEDYPIKEWKGSNGIKISFHPKPKTRRCKRK